MIFWKEELGLFFCPCWFTDTLCKGINAVRWFRIFRNAKWQETLLHTLWPFLTISYTCIHITHVSRFHTKNVPLSHTLPASHGLYIQHLARVQWMEKNHHCVLCFLLQIMLGGINIDKGWCGRGVRGEKERWGSMVHPIRSTGINTGCLAPPFPKCGDNSTWFVSCTLNVLLFDLAYFHNF